MPKLEQTQKLSNQLSSQWLKPKLLLCCVLRFLRSLVWGVGPESLVSDAVVKVRSPEEQCLPPGSVVVLAAGQGVELLKTSLGKLSLSVTASVTVRLLSELSRYFPRLANFSNHSFLLNPAAETKLKPEGWYNCPDGDPSFLLCSSQRRMPGGLVIFRFNWQSDLPCRPRLYFDCGEGASEQSIVNLCGVESGTSATLVKLPLNVKSLRFDPFEEKESFAVTDVSIEELRFSNSSRLLDLKQGLVALSPHYNLYLKTIAEETRNGWAFQRWLQKEGELLQAVTGQAVQQLCGAAAPCRFSILMPVYNPYPIFLQAAIDSVFNQSYQHWELCIADDCSTDPEVAAVLARAGQNDSRVRVISRYQQGHISAATNSALQLATGDFCVLLDHDDLLAKDALLLVAAEICRHPEAAIIYSDEDKIHSGAGLFLNNKALDDGIAGDDSGKSKEYRCDPYFKPDWNPELSLTQNFVSHLGVYRRDLMLEVGGFRAGVEGAQDWDLLLRCVEKISSKQIRHLPYILYHWRVAPGSIAAGLEHKPYAYQAGQKVIADALLRRQIDAQVRNHPEDSGSYRVKYRLKPGITAEIVIPTRDNLAFLERCVGSLLSTTSYQPYSVVIVDNSSCLPETLEYLEDISRLPQVSVLRFSKEFNFSAMANLVLSQSQSDVVVLLNDDTEVTDAGWLEEMVSHAQRREVGVCGARLFYPNKTLQHAGVILGAGGIANHAFYGLHATSGGHQNRARLVQQYSAVTGACMAFRRSIWSEVGGFNETDLPCAFNDVDFCLRVTEKGYRVVWTPFATLLHFESRSLGVLGQRSKQRELAFERDSTYMRNTWGKKLLVDPAYNPNFCLKTASFVLPEQVQG